MKNTTLNSKKSIGFTIVELLVVIVVIGILAAITIVSYSGISTKAKIASIQSDLSNAATQLGMFNVDNGEYPTTISTDCAASPTTTTNLCLKPSAGNSYTSIPYSRPTAQSFILTEVNGDITYNITESSPSTSGTHTNHLNPADWLTIGTQTWAKANLNVGTMITGATTQTNNSTLEKYCYDNDEANCTTYGGLYQWDEAMQYTNAESAQGICPTGSHIPSDADWTILETYLGSVNAGTQLVVGGSSGLNMPFGGFRFLYWGDFYSLSTFTSLWSSSESSTGAWYRYLATGSASLDRSDNSKTYGFSVRCIGN